MPSSYTASARFVLQATGEGTNVWGTILNSGAFSLIDEAIAGITTSSTATLTLSTSNGATDQARKAILNYTGSTAGVWTIPSVSKVYQVRNPSAQLTITNGSNSLVLVAGDSATVATDGTSIWKIQSADFANRKITSLATPTSNYDAATKKYVDDTAFAMAAGALPGQPGNSGKFLSTDGANAFWDTVISTSIGGLSGAVTFGQVSRGIGLPGDMAQIALSLAETRGGLQNMASGMADAYETQTGVSATTNFSYMITDSYAQSAVGGAVTWTQRTASTANAMYGVAASTTTPLFVAVENASGSLARRSTDGITWTSSAAMGGTDLPFTIRYVEAWGLFVVLRNNLVITTSPDGVTWTNRLSAGGAAYFYNFAYAADKGIGVAVGDASGGAGQIYTSTNGTSWTSRTSGTSSGLLSVAYSQSLSLFVAATTGGTAYVTSSDGITWTARTASFSFGGRDIAWSPSRALFVAPSGNDVYTSPDGLTWTLRTTGSTKAINRVSWFDFDGLFIASGGDSALGVIYTSPDGITWTSRTSPVAIDLWSVDYSPSLNLYAMVGNAKAGVGTILTSPGGALTTSTLTSTTFTAVSSPGRGNITLLGKALSGSIVPNTSLVAAISRDGGTTWSNGTLAALGTYGGFTTYEATGVDLSSQPSGSSMRYRVTVDGSARHEFSGACLQWSGD